jgi:putative zinc finger protein
MNSSLFNTRKSRAGMANENEITCQEFVEMVTDYMEQVLLPEIRSQFEKHADNCPGCDIYLNQMRQTIDMLHMIADEPVSADTRQKLLRAFGQWQQELKPDEI